MNSASPIHTVVVEGPLAFAMRRYEAARTNDIGLLILGFPQLAARLVGGLIQPITAETLEPAIHAALKQKGFKEIESVCELPGMTRAVAKALHKVWNADIDLSAYRGGEGPARLQDLATIEQRLRGSLGSTTLLPQDLAEAAVLAANRAPLVLGPVSIEHVSWIPPLWRKLIDSLHNSTRVEWIAPVGADHAWFPGQVKRAQSAVQPAQSETVCCADPRHEAIEALRWIRELLTSAKAAPNEIGIAAASPSGWDEYFLGLRANAGLRIHFTHGVPALSIRDGQRCAALADILVRGLSEQRVRRLVALCAGERTVLDRLPQDWLQALPRGASLDSLGDWERVLNTVLLTVEGAVAVLLPLLSLFARGPEAAAEVGSILLRGRSRTIWQTALRAGPPHAIELALQKVRLQDDSDPADSVVWSPTSHLAAAPRRWVRLLGLTSGGLPRSNTENPLLPSHVIPARQLDPFSVADSDRLAFSIIARAASGQLVLSRSRRTAQGSRVGPSPLLPAERQEQRLARARVPQHAFSESDRLMARPQEAAGLDWVRTATTCWRNWHRNEFTDHDGQFSANHPGIGRALARVQSPTSLQLLLRGPLGFVWRYALGWWAPTEAERPLTIAPEAFGALVHEILRRSVDTLEPSPGFAQASSEEIDAATNAAAALVRDEWPLSQAVPPQLLWRNTVNLAAQLASRALLHGKTKELDAESWPEVPFGDPDFQALSRAPPWDPTVPVRIPGTEIQFRGKIDRLDLRRVKNAVRVTDYKTGAIPIRADKMVIRGGAELQRSLYALACKQLLPDFPYIAARLLYLSGEPQEVRLMDLDAALKQIGEFVGCACEFLNAGVALQGLDVESPYNDLRLALPASPAYHRRKRSAFARRAGKLGRYWDAR